MVLCLLESGGFSQRACFREGLIYYDNHFTAILIVCIPCPCGNFGGAQKACSCAPAVVTKYQTRISGSILDRIDIHVEVPGVDYEKLSSNRLGKSSSDICACVQSARERQLLRFADSANIISNYDMRVAELRKFCKLNEVGESRCEPQ